MQRACASVSLSYLVTRRAVLSFVLGIAVQDSHFDKYLGNENYIKMLSILTIIWRHQLSIQIPIRCVTFFPQGNNKTGTLKDRIHLSTNTRVLGRETGSPAASSRTCSWMLKANCCCCCPFWLIDHAVLLKNTPRVISVWVGSPQKSSKLTHWRRNKYLMKGWSQNKGSF